MISILKCIGLGNHACSRQLLPFSAQLESEFSPDRLHTVRCRTLLADGLVPNDAHTAHVPNCAQSLWLALTLQAYAIASQIVKE